MAKKLFKHFKPSQYLILGYFGAMILGFLLLSLPFLHSETINGIDNFFTAVSAVSTTGLVTIDVASSYNFAGELLIILLIQIGGIGYMSLGSFLVLNRNKRISRLSLELIKSDFSLPDGFSALHFIKNVVWFCLSIELIGAIFLYLIFISEGVSNPAWNAIFHSISAFCTAGFSLLNSSFEGLSDNFYLNMVVTLLSISGAVGFIVFSDIYERLTGRKDRITFTSKIILSFTFTVIGIGFILLLISESVFSTVPQEHAVLLSLFQSMTALTTVGFNSYPIGQLSSQGLIIITVLMLIGASPSGTGGGIKSTTITALWAIMMSTLKGEREVTFRGRLIPGNRLRVAIGSFFFYILVLITGIFLLMLTETGAMYPIIFEATSALGTVGLSMGLTGELSTLGKWIVIFLMFLGRIGPISLGITLLGGDEESSEDEDSEIIEEDLAI